MREVTDLLAESFHLTDQEEGGTASKRAAEPLQQPGGVGKVASEKRRGCLRTQFVGEFGSLTWVASCSPRDRQPSTSSS